MTESLKGRLLVATPGLGEDPNFARTVVLVLEHSDKGAAGVVLNRPSGLSVADVLPDWDAFSAEPAVVFVGGPVRQGDVVCLGRAAGLAGFEPVVHGVGPVDLKLPKDELHAALSAIRFFSGYAGWDALQLEGEIAARGWFVVDCVAEDVLTSEPLRLWRSVLRRQRSDVAMYANYPIDVSLN